MKILTVSIPLQDIKIIKEFIEYGLYSNITECIRIALRDYLWDELQKLR
ncbi:MAG: ribbon-helix-helix domain-containing protein [Candidatus Helarchaeota archaeon]